MTTRHPTVTDEGRRLLEGASELSFWQPEGKHGIGAGGLVITCGAYNEYGCGDTANRDLIVYAVSHLPAFLAAVEALQRLVAVNLIEEEDATPADQDEWAAALKQAGAALAPFTEEPTDATA